jgi:uncharacterized protein YicC (UPF0701 family)
MTGFGRAEAGGDGVAVTVEARSVNPTSRSAYRARWARLRWMHAG